MRTAPKIHTPRGGKVNIHRETIIREINGMKYRASYKVEKGYVTVYGDLGDKTAKITGNSREGIEALAGLLMSELINENKITPR